MAVPPELELVLEDEIEGGNHGTRLIILGLVVALAVGYMIYAAFPGNALYFLTVSDLSRVNEHTLRYEFTVDDPATFTRPFTAVIPMNGNPQPIFEYACHEGNYGLRNLLTGARAQEKAAEEAATGSR